MNMIEEADIIEAVPGRNIRLYPHSMGFVSVPDEDLTDRDRLLGIGHGELYFCFHSIDPTNKERILYRDVTVD